MDNEANLRSREKLIALLKTGRALALTGAGVSVWAGYRIWTKVLKGLAARVVEVRDGEVNVEAVLENNQDPLHCARRLGNDLGREDNFG